MVDKGLVVSNFSEGILIWVVYDGGLWWCEVVYVGEVRIIVCMEIFKIMVIGIVCSYGMI